MIRTLFAASNKECEFRHFPLSDHGSYILIRYQNFRLNKRPREHLLPVYVCAHVVNVVTIKLCHTLAVCLNNCDVTSPVSDPAQRETWNEGILHNHDTDRHWSLCCHYHSPCTQLTAWVWTPFGLCELNTLLCDLDTVVCGGSGLSDYRHDGLPPVSGYTNGRPAISVLGGRQSGGGGHSSPDRLYADQR